MAPDGYRVGVLGATGAVGSTMLEVLAERGFPAAEVVAFASERSVGRKLGFDGRELECRRLDGEGIQGLDLVLSSAGGDVSAEWAPKLVQAGTVVGYVGQTGDASGPHDHFEWHPNAIPANPWRSSAGYAVIRGAIDPFPFLVQVCS